MYGTNRQIDRQISQNGANSLVQCIVRYV